jgi:hypothetical protein
MNEFFSKLLDLYFEIKFPHDIEKLAVIDKYINWYLADEQNSYISTKTDENQVIVEIDIKSAFPTICNALYKNDKDKQEYLTHINQPNLQKTERLIYLVKNLTPDERRDLNIICKIIIMGILFFEVIGDIIILEIKKDGLIAIVSYNDYERIKNLNNTNNKFIKLLLENNFVIKCDIYNKYIRSNKTTWFINDTDISIKGIYKHQPKFILKELNNIVFKNTINDIENLKKYYYDELYYKLIFKNNLNKLLENYYFCDEKHRILTPDQNYTDYKYGISINPFLYVQLFIFPILLSSRIC